MNAKLTREENMVIVHNLAQNGGSEFCFKQFHIDKNKHRLSWHKLIQSDVFLVIASVAIFAIMFLVPLPAKIEQDIVLVAPFLYIVLFILDDSKHIGDEYNPNKIQAYSDHVLNKIGIKTDARHIIGHEIVKRYEQDIADLSVFAYCVNKQKDVDAILKNYTNLSVIADGLTQAWNTKATGNSTTMRLKEQYWRLLNNLVNDLYKLVEPSIEKVTFKLITQKDYQFLPADLGQALVNQHNERLLHDLEAKNR